ncbi:hypothetical protein RB620_06305 [Paenibacillus sp. LHD-117]|uniref:hypothetical protein n=1 Tax=Paenibacillus sp. LHD-117 TaxID=3071412 RepID=UPI0027E1DF4E|nr:hypothetical protein [Paenibacillus sp. LHD-117]MDQ6419047.1 hypothetical protein [Paenibacillus sp. LHD-117]
MAKLTPDEARSALRDMQEASGMDVSGVLAYIEDLESKAAKLEDEVRKLRLSAARKSSPASSMNSRLKDALRE